MAGLLTKFLEKGKWTEGIVKIIAHLLDAFLDPVDEPEEASEIKIDL